MTVAADILALYARDWHIDSTPTLRDPYVSLESAERDPDAEILPSGDTLLIIGSAIWTIWSTSLQWTTATVEVAHWTGMHLRHVADATNVPVPRSIEGTDPPEPDRAQRAVAAVRDLARWLGTTERNAADLAGNYRRSYYNWLKGMQPYPATTLNLYEAHALVASLVDAFGDERAAKAWLDSREGPGNWQPLLATQEGRARLTRAASTVLFKPSDRPAWSPDDDLTHDATPRPRLPEGDRPPPVVPRLPDAERPSGESAS
jgi:hypothetical protein